MIDRRAMTLVELLVAIALLTAVVAATASWLQITSRTATVAAASTRFEAAADAVFRLIEEDIAVGDFDKPPRRQRRVPRNPRDSRNDKVATADGVLQIQTRSVRGPVVHRYVVSQYDHQLYVTERTPGGASSRRLLLDNVSEVHFGIDTLGEVQLTVG